MAAKDKSTEPLTVSSRLNPIHRPFDEKEGNCIQENVEIDVVKGKEECFEEDSVTDSKLNVGDAVHLVNGEPIIENGHDVSRFLVDTRDDGDPPLTFRSLFLGTVFAGLSASLYQVR